MAQMRPSPVDVGTAEEGQSTAKANVCAQEEPTNNTVIIGGEFRLDRVHDHAVFGEKLFHKFVIVPESGGEKDEVELLPRSQLVDEVRFVHVHVDKVRSKVFVRESDDVGSTWEKGMKNVTLSISISLTAG